MLSIFSKPIISFWRHLPSLSRGHLANTCSTQCYSLMTSNHNIGRFSGNYNYTPEHGFKASKGRTADWEAYLLICDVSIINLVLRIWILFDVKRFLGDNGLAHASSRTQIRWLFPDPRSGWCGGVTRNLLTCQRNVVKISFMPSEISQQGELQGYTLCWFISIACIEIYMDVYTS